MKKIKVVALLMIPLTILNFTGCGDDSETAVKKETEDSDVVRQNAYSGEECTITYSMWGGNERYEYTVESIKKFEDTNPGITVDLVYYAWDGFEDKMDDWIESGTEADVMQLNYSWVDKYSEDGNGFENLYDYADIINIKENYTDEVLWYGTRNEKLVAIPIAMNNSVCLHNEAIYEKYNIDIPTTIEDLKKAAVVLYGYEGVYPLEMEDKQLVPFLFALEQETSGHQAFDENGKLNLSRFEIQSMLIQYKNLINAHALCPEDMFSDENVSLGTVAGVVCWNSSIDKYTKLIEKAGGTAYLGSYLSDSSSESSGVYVKPVCLYAMSKNSENKEAAAYFIEYLLNSKENALLQECEKGVPLSKSAEMVLMEAEKLNNQNYIAKITLDYNMENMEIKPNILEDQDFVDLCIENFLGYVNGDVPLNVAADNIFIAANK